MVDFFSNVFVYSFFSLVLSSVYFISFLIIVPFLITVPFLLLLFLLLLFLLLLFLLLLFLLLLFLLLLFLFHLSHFISTYSTYLIQLGLLKIFCPFYQLFFVFNKESRKSFEIVIVARFLDRYCVNFEQEMCSHACTYKV